MLGNSDGAEAGLGGVSADSEVTATTRTSRLVRIVRMVRNSNSSKFALLLTSQFIFMNICNWYT